MAKFKEGYIVQILYEGDDLELKKYNKKFGLIHYVDDRANLSSVHYTVLVPDMFSVWIEEKWLKNANSWERWKCAYDLAGSKGLDLISTSSGKLYCNGTLIAEVTNANNCCYSEKALKDAAERYLNEKENNTMRFEDETIVKISGYPGFKSRNVWGVIKRYYGDGTYGVYSLSKPMENYGVFDEKYLTAYEEVIHDPKRVINPGTNLAILTSANCLCLCEITSVSFEPNSRPEYDLMEIDSGCEFRHNIYKDDFILVRPIKRNYKDVIVDPTPTSVYLAKNYARPKKVIFHDPATIVFWSDGDKTIVKAGKGEVFDPEKGLAMAVSKKFLGKTATKYDYYEVFKKFLLKHKEDKKND